MKYLVLIAAVATLFSCKKENINAKIQGTWELREYHSAWLETKYFPVGNGNTIKFSNNTYTTQTKTADTAYSNNGTYKLYSGKPCTSAKEQQLIKFESSNIPSGITLQGDELIISSNECVEDGDAATYQKIND